MNPATRSNIALNHAARPIMGFARAAACLTIAGLALGMAGCETDSFLDPSTTGRWERTPTKVPILTRIASIEGIDDTGLDYSEPTASDLVPELSAYRLGPGDAIEVEIWDIPVQDRVERYERPVDTQGFIELPQLGEIYVAGKTAEGARVAIAEAMSKLVNSPLASVNIVNRRQQTYHVFGAIERTGTYFIPAADFRLLEALTAAGNFSITAREILVIRQIPLDEAAAGQPVQPAGTQQPRSGEPAQPTTGDDLMKIIDDLSQPPAQDAPPPPPPPANPPGSAPGVFGSDQPGTTPPPPPVDLPESSSAPARPTGQGMPADTSWVFINGRWVQIARPPTQTPSGELDTSALVTQRVIRVPVKQLIAGDARVNVVIRPGDMIRVVPQDIGNIYIAGQVARPGVFTLPDSSRLTITRAIDSAGGLGSLAIPERVDLTRMTSETEQATIRLNLRAIAEGTHPDVFLKPDDRINVGSNFWAYPLAVIRNGFRFTYGFGFVLDRNFDDDVFGPQDIRN